MARDENPPFPRGQVGTYYSDPATIDTTGGAQLEGTEWWFEDLDLSLSAGVGTAPTRSGRKVKCRVVRNTSSAAMLPKRVVTHKTTNKTTFAGQVGGYAATVGTDPVAGVVDEFLPAAGAAVNDLFYIVVQGPSKVTTAGAGDTNMAAGVFVIPSTAGTVIEQDTTVAAGAATFNQIQGRVGQTMEAVNAISTDVMIDVRLG